MRSEWQDLLPFYVSGQLTDAERVIVEQALHDSEECRQALLEWKRVASLVRKEAGTWGTRLPPLEEYVRSAARTPPTQIHLKPVTDDSMAATTPIRLRSQARTAPPLNKPSRLMNMPVPLTLVASVLMVVVIGGLLVTFWRSGSGQPQFGSDIAETRVSVNATTTPEIDLGILTVPEPTAIPVWPTNTSGPEIAQMSELSILRDGCFAASATGQNVRIYNAPDTTSSIVTTLNPALPQAITAFDPSGWYELSHEDGAILGWVRAIEITLSGMCDNVPRSTAVMELPDQAEGCNVSSLNALPVALYIEPSIKSTVIQEIRDFSTTYVVGRLDTGEWYRVRHDSLGSVWVGWIRAAAASFSRECQMLQIVQLPSSEPVPLASSTPTAVALPELQSFAAPEIDVAQPGASVRLEWRATNTTRVSIEFYSADVAIEDYGVAKPLASYDNLLPEGSLDVIIPATYSYPRAIFVLVMARNDSTDRGPTGILVVPIDQ